MRVRNVHRRALERAAPVAAMIDALGGPDDRLWPRARWPPMRLDRGLHEGARGGHGPIRYTVEQHEPGRRVRFRFERPRGFHGFHEFRLLDEATAELVHVLDATFTGVARVSWPLVYRPLHDALIEDALDNAQRVSGGLARPAVWSPYVRVLRRTLAVLAQRP